MSKYADLVDFAILPGIDSVRCCDANFGKDPMQRKLQPNGTYWEVLEFEGLKDKTRYEKQFLKEVVNGTDERVLEILKD